MSPYGRMDNLNRNLLTPQKPPGPLNNFFSQTPKNVAQNANMSNFFSINRPEPNTSNNNAYQNFDRQSLSQSGNFTRNEHQGFQRAPEKTRTVQTKITNSSQAQAHYNMLKPKSVKSDKYLTGNVINSNKIFNNKDFLKFTNSNNSDPRQEPIFEVAPPKKIDYKEKLLNIYKTNKKLSDPFNPQPLPGEVMVVKITTDKGVEDLCLRVDRDYREEVSLFCRKHEMSDKIESSIVHFVEKSIDSLDALLMTELKERDLSYLETLRDSTQYQSTNEGQDLELDVVNLSSLTGEFEDGDFDLEVDEEMDIMNNTM